MRRLLLAENTEIISNVDLLVKSSKKDGDGNILAVFSLGFEKFIVLDINCAIDIRGELVYLDYLSSTILGIKPPEFDFIELFFMENFDIIKKNFIKRCG